MINAPKINDDGKIKYQLRGGNDKSYFKIEKKTGEITLQKIIDKPVGCKLKFQVAVVENINEPLKNHYFHVEIRIVRLDVEPSVSIIMPLNKTIEIPENFNNFTATIVKLEAKSNINDKPGVRFQLLQGFTESRNQSQPFRLEQFEDKAVIKLSGNLDYESIKKYELKIRVLNDENGATEITVNIFITDVNDNIPYFYQTDIKTATIPIDTIPGTTVTRVRAIDNDATSMHNKISYKLNNYQDIFMIDELTGMIESLVQFDSVDTYNIEIIAFDNSPSIFHDNGAPNSGKRYLTIYVVNCPVD